MGIGRKLEDLFGSRSRQISKLKILLDLAASRLAVLRNHRRSRCSHARDAVAHLLLLGQHDRALIRAEMVIKEQNMLDVFAMVESYCHLLIERAFLLRQNECPEELREAAAGLIFAASRCGELPEVREVRRIFSSRFGKEFIAAATELRNNCGINLKMVQKLSTRQPSLEIRAKVTKEIAMERGIRFELIGSFSEDSEIDQNSIQQTDSVTMNQEKFRDVGSAAQAAFESATCAAAAAKAAVELLRSESEGQLEHLVGNAESTTKKKPIQKGSGNGCHSPLSASSSSDSNGFSLEREKKEGGLFDGSESDMEKKNAAGDEEDVHMEMESPEQEDQGSSRVCPAPMQSFLAADNALVRSNPSSVRTRR